MIARHWRGWTKLENAEAYESLLKTKVLLQLSEIPGYGADMYCETTALKNRNSL